MKRVAIAILVVFAASLPVRSDGRIASDFEIASMQSQLSRSRNPMARVAALLNLGDLRHTRGEGALSRESYGRAIEILDAQRAEGRRRQDLAKYAVATAWRGLAEAKLGRESAAFDAFEEALRYVSDSPGIWNLYASAMTVAGRPEKAVASARNAVMIANADAGATPLDRHVYEYTLASALLAMERDRVGEQEAETLLSGIIESLAGRTFETLRRRIVRNEEFEILSSTEQDASAYLALFNRSRLRLARLYEQSGRPAAAREQYRAVLAARSDDAQALGAMARLTREAADRERYFEESLDANPFSRDLIREYEAYIAGEHPRSASGSGPGAAVRNALHAQRAGRFREASESLQPLLARFPENDVVRFLLARNAVALGDMKEADRLETRIRSRALRGELAAIRSSLVTESIDILERGSDRDPSDQQVRALFLALQRGSLSAAQVAVLDSLVISAVVVFAEGRFSGEETTSFDRGMLHSVPFRFPAPAAFRGRFEGSRVRLEFRILGATEIEGAAGLLLEPLRITPS
ncbi:MAG TPA: tetratricopeptide repeat protein [Thermoanaerobaculia bacterium]|nr:tetratricopeptide repeat protein [Thermoanaerobaculia bacterium]